MKRSIAGSDLRRISNLSAVLLILVALLGVQLLMGSQFTDARQLREEANRIIQNRANLAKLLELHLEAETGVRGFVLTASESFIGPYTAAVNRRESIFRALEATGEPSTVARIPELQRLSDLKLANAAAQVREVRAGAIEAARERVRSGEGNEFMIAIRSRIAEADRLEAATLVLLERESENARGRAESLISLLLLGIALILIATTLVLARAISQRRVALIAAKQVAEQERAMFDGAVDGMLLLDARGRILRTNPSVQRMFLYTEDELIGRSNMFLMAEPFSEEQSLAWLSRVGRAGIDGAGRRQEFLGKRADGSTFETEVAISRFGQDDDRRYVAAIRDITHRKRAERMKSEFVSTVSHELRTPLTSIAGSLALLAGGAVGELHEKAARLVAIAHGNCERLIRLINDLLDIEKIESGKMTFTMRQLDLGPLIQRTVNANRQFARDHAVALEVGLPQVPQLVMGDPDRLEQVLTNLVSNAIKYSPRESSIYVTTVPQGSRVRIEVHDRGSGVPEDFRDRIFSKFAMADASDTRLRGGTGLGLAIVREIVARHGGTTGFDDRAGGGSVFWFELPLVGDRRAAPRPRADDMPTILHLDEDSDCHAAVARAFADRAAIVGAGTAHEAHTILGREPVAACIVDPAASGGEALAMLAGRDAEMPVVIFTDMDDIDASVPADAVLVKSRTSLDRLVETVLQLVREPERKAS